MQPRSQLYGQIRVGRVSSVDADRHSAQVQFAEIDGFVSWDLQVLHGFVGDYCLPAQNTPVLCLLIDGRLGVGYVLGAVYTDADAAPLNDASQRAIVGDDIRLGDASASDKVGVAPKTDDAISAFFSLLDGVFGNSSTALVTAAPGAPDVVYVAMKAAIAAYLVAHPGKWPPVSVAAENVSAK
ncbi:MAG TPA: hypothetical protein VIA18_26340 [Polyangia bacterium]|nr:hypothetical protein [Polyangia bacterium]